MIYDKKRERVLLRNGATITSPEHYAKMILKGESTEGIHVVPCHDADVFDYVYQEDTQRDIEYIPVIPKREVSEEDRMKVVSHVFDSGRWEDGMEDRVEREMKFFDDTNNIDFLYKCVCLVDKFRETGTLWGVGRGSSCASLVMYLLYVNDINPLKYDIPFSEFSKVQEMSDG